MNNKGQSLVLFILMIPILIGIIALVVDLGNAWVEKNKLDNITEIVLEYSLEENEIEEKKVEELMNYNTNKKNSNITINNNVITIETKTYTEGIFSKLLNIPGFKIISKYKGYIKDNKSVIEKEI